MKRVTIGNPDEVGFAKAKLWKCPRCRRQFERKGQLHSCRVFPLRQHFYGKTPGKLLYNKLKLEIKRVTGPFRVESLECCIHFVSTFTFASVKIYRDKIQVHFTLDRKLKGSRLAAVTRYSANRYLHCINVYTNEEINEELISWIEEARMKRSGRAVA